jgi:hypothetical protein
MASGCGCGHTRHVGTCAACQRLQLARWRAQLAEAQAARDNASGGGGAGNSEGSGGAG